MKMAGEHPKGRLRWNEDGGRASDWLASIGGKTTVIKLEGMKDGVEKETQHETIEGNKGTEAASKDGLNDR